MKSPNALFQDQTPKNIIFLENKLTNSKSFYPRMKSRSIADVVYKNYDLKLN